MPTAAPCQIAPLADRLPVLHAEAARLASLCADPRLGRLLAAAGLAWSVRPQAAAPDGPLYRVQLASDDGPIELLLSAPDHPALPMIAAPGIDPALARLAAAALLEPVLACLEPLGMAGVQAVAVDGIAADGAGGSGDWCVARDAAGRELRLALWRCPDPVVLRLRQRLGGARARPAHRALAMRGTVTLGVHRVALDTLRGLRRGDVLIAPWLPPTEGRDARVRWGLRGARGLEAAARLEARSLTLQGAPTMTDAETTVRDDTDDDPVDNLAELDIPVRFEIETVAMPLAELAALGPGMVVELSTPLCNAGLRLTACGQTIAQAELVAVGDHLGARITRMVTRDERQPDA